MKHRKRKLTTSNDSDREDTTNTKQKVDCQTNNTCNEYDANVHSLIAHETKTRSSFTKLHSKPDFQLLHTRHNEKLFATSCRAFQKSESDWFFEYISLFPNCLLRLYPREFRYICEHIACEFQFGKCLGDCWKGEKMETQLTVERRLALPYFEKRFSDDTTTSVSVIDFLFRCCFETNTGVDRRADDVLCESAIQNICGHDDCIQPMCYVSIPLNGLHPRVVGKDEIRDVCRMSWAKSLSAETVKGILEYCKDPMPMFPSACNGVKWVGPTRGQPVVQMDNGRYLPVFQLLSDSFWKTIDKLNLRLKTDTKLVASGANTTTHKHTNTGIHTDLGIHSNVSLETKSFLVVQLHLLYERGLCLPSYKANASCFSSSCLNRNCYWKPQALSKRSTPWFASDCRGYTINAITNNTPTVASTLSATRLSMPDTRQALSARLRESTNNTRGPNPVSRTRPLGSVRIPRGMPLEQYESLVRDGMKQDFTLGDFTDAFLSPHDQDGWSEIDDTNVCAFANRETLLCSTSYRAMSQTECAWFLDYCRQFPHSSLRRYATAFRYICEHLETAFEFGKCLGKRLQSSTGSVWKGSFSLGIPSYQYNEHSTLINIGDFLFKSCFWTTKDHSITSNTGFASCGSRMRIKVICGNADCIQPTCRVSERIMDDVGTGVAVAGSPPKRRQISKTEVNWFRKLLHISKSRIGDTDLVEVLCRFAEPVLDSPWECSHPCNSMARVRFQEWNGLTQGQPVIELNHKSCKTEYVFLFEYLHSQSPTSLLSFRHFDLNARRKHECWFRIPKCASTCLNMACYTQRKVNLASPLWHASMDDVLFDSVLNSSLPLPQ